MEFIDPTKEVYLKDKPFLTLTEAAKYTGVGQHKLSELSDDPRCQPSAHGPERIRAKV